MIHQSESPRHEMTSGEAGVVGAVLGFGLVALALYLAIARYHIRKEQLVEAGLYLFILAAAFVGPVLRKLVTRGTRTKRPPCRRRRDRAARSHRCRPHRFGIAVNHPARTARSC